MKKLISSILALTVTITGMTTIPLTSVNAAETTGGEYEIKYDDSDRVIVSLGDSYSAGEGIDNFYDYNLPISERVKSQDWLSHRSHGSWPGQLTLKDSNGNSIVMEDHRDYVDSEGNYHEGNWYFAAMSGAVTGNILDTNTIPENDKDKKEYEHRFKKYKKLIGVKVNLLNPLVPKPDYLEGSVEIEPQLNIFEQLGNKKTDYVTITMGGNDIGFTDIVTRALLNVPYLEYASKNAYLIKNQPISKWVLSSKLEKMVNEVLPITKERLEESYKRIAEKAGKQAHIIVAGYPKILSSQSKNPVFTKTDADMINEKVSDFNDAIKEVVDKCQNQGIKISFVSVINEFGDYGAYYPGNPEDELINRLCAVKPQDINEGFPFVSAYSIHPNDKGAKVYADCVQKEIKKIEDEKTRVWGRIVDKNSNPISEVKVILTDDNNEVNKTDISDSDGNYGIELNYKEGRHYTVKFEAEGYEPLVVKEEKGGNRITINAKLKKQTQTQIAIPSDALSYNGHSYYIYSGVANTWEEAKTYCESLGGYLAVINDDQENTAIYNYLKNCGHQSAYFGYTDSETEGIWKWVNNDTSNYTNWASGEPNSENVHEDYAMFYFKFTDGKWNDGDFSGGTVLDTTAFICEWDTSNQNTTEYTAEDLISKSSKEIIKMTGDVFSAPANPYSHGYNYFYYYGIFPGMKFYVNITDTSLNFYDEVHYNDYNLMGIQVEDTGKAFVYKDTIITADMDYNRLSEIFGEIKCKRGTGALISGAFMGLTYQTETDKCIVKINFDVDWNIQKYLSEDIEVPTSEMALHNPKIKNIVIIRK